MDAQIAPYPANAGSPPSEKTGGGRLEITRERHGVLIVCPACGKMHGLYSDCKFTLKEWEGAIRQRHKGCSSPLSKNIKDGVPQSGMTTL